MRSLRKIFEEKTNFERFEKSFSRILRQFCLILAMNCFQAPNVSEDGFYQLSGESAWEKHSICAVLSFPSILKTWAENNEANWQSVEVFREFEAIINWEVEQSNHSSNGSQITESLWSLILNEF